MSSPGFHTLSLTQLSQGLDNGDFTSVEIVRALLERIAAHGDALNCFITVTADAALQAAEQADAARRNGDTGALNGLPLVHKDIFCTRGVLTTCGSRMLDNFISPYDATVVERLAAAGAIMLGKTNMDEFAMGSSNETSYFGPVHNPWDLECSPGGSSGGSSASVAARLTPAATGTDTGGSIRQPAALTGTTGLKPTYGRVSRYGMIAFASSLDQAGVITRSAEDAALLLGVMAGFDERDSTSIDHPVPDYVAGLGQSLEGLRVGIVKQHFDAGLDEQTGAAVREALAAMEAAGAVLTDVDMPDLDLSVPTYYVVAPCEASSNLARYDGAHYGYRCDESSMLADLQAEREAAAGDKEKLEKIDTALVRMYRRSRAEGFGPEVKRRIMLGTYALSAGYYDAYYLKAQQVRHLIADDFKRAFKDVDIIAGPTAPTPAFRLGDKTDDPITMYLNDIYTIGANLAGLPGISVPCGFAHDLPVGLHLVAPHFGEETLLAAAHQYQLLTDWHRRCPEAYT